MIVHTRVTGRDHIRLAFDDESNVTDESFVENPVDRFAIILASVVAGTKTVVHARGCNVRAFYVAEKLYYRAPG